MGLVILELELPVRVAFDIYMYLRRRLRKTRGFDLVGLLGARYIQHVSGGDRESWSSGRNASRGQPSGLLDF